MQIDDCQGDIFVLSSISLHNTVQHPYASPDGPLMPVDPVLLTFYTLIPSVDDAEGDLPSTTQTSDGQDSIVH